MIIINIFNIEISAMKVSNLIIQFDKILQRWRKQPLGAVNQIFLGAQDKLKFVTWPF